MRAVLDVPGRSVVSCPTCHGLRGGEAYDASNPPPWCTCPIVSPVEPEHRAPPCSIVEARDCAGAVTRYGGLDAPISAETTAEWVEWVTGATEMRPPLRFAPDGTFVVMYKGRGRDEARTLALAILRAVEQS